MTDSMQGSVITDTCKNKNKKIKSIMKNFKIIKHPVYKKCFQLCDEENNVYPAHLNSYMYQELQKKNQNNENNIYVKCVLNTIFGMWYPINFVT